MSTLFIISAIVLGFGGSLHCVGMCGPIVMGMPFHTASNKTGSILLYVLAKAIAYATIGVLIGLVGKGLALFALQQALSFTAGIFIIILALLPGILRKAKMPALFNNALTEAYGRVMHKPSLVRFSVFGFLNGLLPCGLVYAAVAAASAVASPLWSGLYMLIFGVANAPALIAVVMVKNKTSLVFRKYFSRFSLVIVLATGVLLIVRSFEGFHQHDSPHSTHTTSVVNCVP